MGRAQPLSLPRPSRQSRLAAASRTADRFLGLAGDVRLGVALLAVAAGVNALAAALPQGASIAGGLPYRALLGLVALTGVAGVAIRAPAAWREWRHPMPLTDSPAVAAATMPLPAEEAGAVLEQSVRRLAAAGYRVAQRGTGARPVVTAVQRGWSPFAGLGVHLALVLLIVGAGMGLAFGHETTFSLLPGDQALLDDARPGFTDAVRLERFDSRFTPDGRPTRLDTTISYLRNGAVVSQQTIGVNSPASIGGYLLHGWTYGPAVRLRVTTLGNRPLLDAGLPLDGSIGGRPGGFVSLPSAGITLGVALADSAGNVLRVTAADASGVIDSAELRPGSGAVRIGSLNVSVDSVAAYVTFLARRDPGMGVVFAGGGLLVLGTAIAFWMPRRRLTLRIAPEGVRLMARAGRWEDSGALLAQTRAMLQR
jgi:cytochrome c biogenesis protein